MMKTATKLITAYFLIFLAANTLFPFLTIQAHAATFNSFTSASDTLSSSRPSAASPLTATVANTATSQLSILNNGSRFLASDSALLDNKSTNTFVLFGSGGTSTETVASQSADLTKVNFTANTASNVVMPQGAGILVAPITAKHTIKFTTQTLVPTGGFLYINFPALTAQDSSNTASPSASTFQFNNLATGNISISFSSGSTTCPTFTFDQANGASSHNIKCTVTTSAINPGTTITVTIGNTTPALINPVKAATAGTADPWAITLQSQDASNNVLDQTTIKAGTIESVQVQASVDPTFSFIIGGLGNGTAFNTDNTGCTNNTDQNSPASAAPTATLIDLGVIGTGINKEGQTIQIKTNGSSGYTLTATSSGHLINPSSGQNFPDSTAATAITAGTPFFGIHPCGADVASGTWGQNVAGNGATKFEWPTVTGGIDTLASNTGPVDGSTTNNGKIDIEYAATANATFPAGNYSTVVTYVATPQF